MGQDGPGTGGVDAGWRAHGRDRNGRLNSVLGGEKGAEKGAEKIMR
ncbi:MAG: hypothetical protein JWP59_276 [Massilia sp.]|nr:hypothetical protein [Massilia sp.]